MAVAACGGHDPYVGSWRPVNVFVGGHEIEMLVIRKANAGYEATLTVPDGTPTSVHLRQGSADILVTDQPPAQGGFALHYEPNSGLLEYVQSGGAAPLVFRKT